MARQLICLLALVGGATAACLPVLAPVQFHDMHDGDMKQIEADIDNHFVITPYNNTESWNITGTLDENCTAMIDFHVPGKPAYPPVPLLATMWILGSSDDKLTKLGFEFTDPSGTLAPPTQSVNFWVQHEWPHGTSMPVGLPKPVPNPSWCIYTPALKPAPVFNDMHDGDAKEIRVSGSRLDKDKLTIKPHGNSQKWTVVATFDSDCIANVNFDVPGKPNPPPVPLAARVWSMVSIGYLERDSLLFTDPSATIASPIVPLNAWLGPTRAEPGH
jgi:hypothetical protein